MSSLEIMFLSHQNRMNIQIKWSFTFDLILMMSEHNSSISIAFRELGFI